MLCVAHRGNDGGSRGHCRSSPPLPSHEIHPGSSSHRCRSMRTTLKLGRSGRSCLVSCGRDSGCSPHSCGGPPLGPIHRQVSGGRCCRRNAVPGCPQGLVSSLQISDRSSTRRTTASPQPAWRTQDSPATHSALIRFPPPSRLASRTF